MKWEKQENSQYWKPENKGDNLIGEILGSEMTEDFGMSYTLKTADGKIAVTPSHKVLQNLMRNSKVGDIVKIVYLGLGEKQKGKNQAKLYEVFIERG